MGLNWFLLALMISVDQPLMIMWWNLWSLKKVEIEVWLRFNIHLKGNSLLMLMDKTTWSGSHWQNWLAKLVNRTSNWTEQQDQLQIHVRGIRVVARVWFACERVSPFILNQKKLSGTVNCRRTNWRQKNPEGVKNKYTNGCLWVRDWAADWSRSCDELQLGRLESQTPGWCAGGWPDS